jgi:hypothetical protein
MSCEHSFLDRQMAMADGYCPFCQAAEIKRLRTELDDAKPPSRRLLEAEVDRLRAERQATMRLTAHSEIIFGGIRLAPGTYEVRGVESSPQDEEF